MKKLFKSFFYIILVLLFAFPILTPMDPKHPPFYFIKNTKDKITKYFTDKLPVPPSSFVNEKILKARLREGLPLWAHQQIKEDLSKFETINPADFDNYLKDPKLAAVHFKIKDGKVKFISRDGIIHNCDKADLDYQYQMAASFVVCDMVQYLAKRGYVQDSEFLLGTYDYLENSSKQSFPIFSYAKDLNIPIERDAILMPDWMNLRSRMQTSNQIRQAIALNPWTTKNSFLFWRGGPFDSTGFREKLVSFSKQHPDLVDAKLTYIVKEDTTRLKQAPSVSISDQLKYKYLISIDGERCTWERLIWHMESNSLVLKHNSRQVQWFYKGLTPGVHYVPFSDEIDLLKQVAWAEHNNDKSQVIIKNANAFVKNHLSLEDMYHYFIVLMQEYNKKLKQGV